ncbi:Response regulator receiver domain-containing protein [Zobellia uliginosa]|uniref:Response regulator receiver domain-containing protein n=1 Tax=Zobellia uliginosa TaxID=143224 RepID=A0ABY1L3H4_9FLAO|nr:response regulator [Zobellia uliginosa]SIS95498.1 Response regulator receiver domain-containing protein [Zobellia uliginosa]
MNKIESICIIDDDPITVFGIQKMLSLVVQCDDITVYRNGKLAIDGIKQRIEENKQAPQVIFLDINMPIMDGWQFLDEFITLPTSEKVRVNIITSSIDKIDLQKWECFKQKTDHTITFNNKPIRKEHVAEITKVA